MEMFEEDDLKKIKEILKKYIKDKKQVTENKEIMEVLNDTTDFETAQYKGILNTIDYYIRYEGYIDNSNLNDFIQDLAELEEKGNRVFTKANVIVSVVTIAILLLGWLSTESVYFLIVMIYGLVWAYLSRFIGLKKGIDSGYVWGYFLGIIGFIVVCVLPNENEDDKNENITSGNKYDDLEKLQKLRESGAITDKEFEIEKAKLLK